MKSLLFFLVAVTWCSACNADIQTFEGYKVYRVRPTTKLQTNLLITLESEDDDLDFWTEPNKADIPVDVMVAPKDQERFKMLLTSSQMEPEVIIDDVEKLIKKQKVSNGLSRSGMTWNSYYKLKEIYDWMDSLPAAFPVATVMKAGETYEKREIKALKISFKPGKRAVFLEGGIHAREWISPATLTYLINELLTSRDPTFRKIAENFDWYIVPVSNPDGFEYTHTSTRLWRKTRAPHGLCKGADPNRNWDIHWGEQGTSSLSCSDTYGGPRAFSEVETKSLSEFIATVGDKLDVYLAFHSYSQLLLMPYGHTTEHLENYDDVLQIGKAAQSALASKYGTSYKVGNIAETIYKASGGSMDWAKATFKVPIAFTYELRDTGRYGFLLPPEQIVPNCEEVMDSVIAIFQEGEKLGYFKLD